MDMVAMRFSSRTLWVEEHEMSRDSSLHEISGRGSVCIFQALRT
jgi:hypothetical protein